jgi:hypothetical protein
MLLHMSYTQATPLWLKRAAERANNGVDTNGEYDAGNI